MSQKDQNLPPVAMTGELHLRMFTMQMGLYAGLIAPWARSAKVDQGRTDTAVW